MRRLRRPGQPWHFAVLICGFFALLAYLSTMGQDLAVQRLGSVMVAAGTLSAAGLVAAKTRLRTAMASRELKQLRTELTATQDYLLTLEDVVKAGHNSKFPNTAKLDALRHDFEAQFAASNREAAEQAALVSEHIEYNESLATANTVVLLTFGTIVWGYGDVVSAYLRALWMGG
ncbi:MAG: hypothetical protein AAF092_16420 [Pseudomonadota bacterium]